MSSNDEETKKTKTTSKGKAKAKIVEEVHQGPHDGFLVFRILL